MTSSLTFSCDVCGASATRAISVDRLPGQVVPASFSFPVTRLAELCEAHYQAWRPDGEGWRVEEARA